MFVNGLTCASSVRIRRTRQLPFPGRVMVTEGQELQPLDQVAAGSLPGDLVTLDIARGLGLSPRDADSCAVREVGDTLNPGDVISQCQNTFTRFVRTPVGGLLVDLSNGKAVLATGTHEVTIQAGMFGKVEVVIPEFGAVITTTGSLVQGVWGNGQIGTGSLRIIQTKEEDPIQPADFDVSTGDVLVVRRCLQPTILEVAAEKGLAGMIFQTMAPELKPLARLHDIPIIVVNGFGPAPENSEGLEIFSSHEGMMASLNACAVDLLRGVRPEVVIPKECDKIQEELGFQVELKVGHKVRVLSGEFRGRSGEISEIAESPKKFESGLILPFARVRVEESELTEVPLQNLVVIGY